MCRAHYLTTFQKDKDSMATTSKALPKFEVPTISAPTKLLTLDLKTIMVNLEGTTPFICHNWDKKNIDKMQAKQAGTASKGREKRDPAQDYEGAFYRLPDGRPGMKLIAFKNAAVTAVTSLGKEFTKVGARQAFFILRDKDGGELTPISYPEDTPPYMRTDTVTVGMGSTDLRYRPEFLRWGVTLAIQFNARVITQDQLVNLINLGGFSVGVGEWRPEKNGDHGRFQVVSNFSWEAK
jgi:hypothetical protein